MTAASDRPIIYTHHCGSPLGGITLTSDGEALTALWFDDQRHFADIADRSPREERLPVFAETERWLKVYFSGQIPDFTPRLALKGTAFRRAVWDILLTVPYGQTTSYGAIARVLARQRGIARMSAQAVGGAVGHHPVGLIVPCHRVIGSGGSLIGYGGGLDRKARLLALENADMSAGFMPLPRTEL